jgi:hypothetical protein
MTAVEDEAQSGKEETEAQKKAPSRGEEEEREGGQEEGLPPLQPLRSSVESMRVKKLIDARGLALPFIGMTQSKRRRNTAEKTAKANGESRHHI